MTGFVVINPRSGGGRTGRDWPDIERALRAAYPHMTLAMTRKPGDATTLVRHALSEQIAAGESRAQPDKTKVNFAPFESLELLCAAHVKKVQRHVRAELSKGSERRRQHAVMDI